MPLVLLGLIAVFVFAWFARRHSTLSRNCRWREDRSQAVDGAQVFRCAFCGAQCTLPAGQVPRRCLRKFEQDQP